MARARTSGKVSALESSGWKKSRGNPGGARSEAKKQGLAERTFPPDPWEAEGLTRVERVVMFLESLPITKGILVGTRMRLLPDQREFIEEIYGDRDSPVQIGVKSEPRGNGKTGLVAGLALCHLLGPEAEPRGEVDSAAVDRPQAAIIHGEMAAICRAVPSLAARVNIQRFHKKIDVLTGKGEGSVYQALSADAPSAHGLAPSLWIYDELAQAKNSELLQALRTAMGKRARSLGLVISTQAPDDEHPLSKLIDDGLSGADPSIVVHLTAAPVDAPWWEPATIRAVNPALGIFLDERTVLNEAAQAKRVPMWQPQFRNLRLNQRIDAETDTRLAQVADWRAAECAQDPEVFLGRPCFGGLDLSSSQDLTALVLVFPDDAHGFDAVPFFWTPIQELDRRQPAERDRMGQWIRAGHVEATPGRYVNYAVVVEKMAELTRRYDVQAIAYDPWRIDVLKRDMDEAGLELPMETFSQGHSKAMAPAIDFFTECLVNGRLRHGGNPALTAAVLGAVLRTDRAGNPAIDKSSSRKGPIRIDGAMALVMALGTARRFEGGHVEGRLVAV